MFVVAIMELARPIDEEAQLLAGDLGITSYEAGMALRPGLPAIILRSPERSRALSLLEKIRARGNGAVAFDDAAVVASRAMIDMHRFRLDDEAIVALDITGTTREVLPYADILALLGATHHKKTDSRREVKEKKFNAGRALLSGGLVMSKTVTTAVVSSVEERQPVLYVFRRSGELPWLLQANHTHYAPLGPLLKLSQLENFTKLVSLLRERAPTATFDQRLVSMRGIGQRLRGDGHGQEQSSAEAVDVLAHIIALWIARRDPHR